MKIFNEEALIIDLGFQPEGIEKKELQVEHSISISFELPYYVKLEKGNYIIHKDQKFRLKKNHIPSINKKTGGYYYDLTFYDITDRFHDIKVKYSSLDMKELDFKLTANGETFLQVIIDSLSSIGAFVKGEAPSDIKEIEFKNISVFDALNLIAEKYGTEWWLSSDVLNLSKCEYGEAVLLRVDKEISDISFSPTSEKLVTRLYAYGSTRNLQPDYMPAGEVVNSIGEKRLRMPVDYVDLFPDLADKDVVEGVKIFEEIYPKQLTTIVEIDEKTLGETTLYTFRGDNTFEITNEDIISGKPLKVAFQTGKLAGREFELILKGDNRFEIKYITENTTVIPNTVLKPEVGDSFFFFNINAGSVLPTLIEEAEIQLMQAATEHLDKIGSEYVYTANTHSIECEKNNINLEIGQLVTLQSPAIGTVTSRVRSYTKDLINEFDCSYDIGDYSKYSRLKELEDMAKSEEWSESGNRGIFEDGIINAMEAVRLRSYIDMMMNEYDSAKARYEEYGMELPEWSDYEQIYLSLSDAINQIIIRGNVTISEKVQIELWLNEYRAALSALMAILDAKVIGDIEQLSTAFSTAQGNLSELSQAMDKLQNETLKAMEDDFISEAERRSLYAVYMRLDVEQEQLLSNVMYTLNSIYMPEEHKDLVSEKANKLLKIGGSLDKYQEAITAILDQIDPQITEHERNVYNKCLAIYKRDHDALTIALRDARLTVDAEIKRLSDEKTDAVEGGKNLIRNYDLRWDFDFWGGVGDYVDVDISNLPIEKKKGLRDQRRVMVDENDNIIEMI